MRSSNTATATIFALSSCCALFFGCTSVSQLRTSSRPAETVVATPGEPVRYTVEIKPLTNEFTTEVDRLPTFLVSITNHSQSPIPVSTANITASSGAHAVRVYDPVEASKLLQNDAKMKLFVAKAHGASQIQAAENAGPIYGGPPVLPTRTSALTSFSGARKDALAELNRATLLLFPYSIPPAATITGVFELHADDIVADRPLTLTVILGTEKHAFYFDVQD